MADDPDAPEPAPIADARPDAPSAAAASPDDRRARLAAIIRNGLSNGPIAQSQTAWDHLQTRLGHVVDALLKEI